MLYSRGQAGPRDPGATLRGQVIAASQLPRPRDPRGTAALHGSRKYRPEASPARSAPTPRTHAPGIPTQGQCRARVPTSYNPRARTTRGLNGPEPPAQSHPPEPAAQPARATRPPSGRGRPLTSAPVRGRRSRRPGGRRPEHARQRLLYLLGKPGRRTRINGRGAVPRSHGNAGSFGAAVPAFHLAESPDQVHAGAQ